MVEPFGKPNKQQIEKAKEMYGDPVIYWATNKAVEALNQMKFGIPERNYWREFYAMARLLILNWNAQLPIKLVELAIEDLADGKSYKWLGKDLNLPDEKEEIKVSIDPTAKEIKNQIKITDIAKDYGLKVKGNMAVCPFHDDKDPSLSLSNEKGCFHCFGCHSKGDIITFVKMLEEIKE